MADNLLATRKMALSRLEELDIMGLTLPALRLLSDRIREIARSHNTGYEAAVREFLKEIEDNLECKISLETKVQRLKSEITELISKRDLNEAIIRSQQNQNRFQCVDNPGLAESRQIELVPNRADDLRVVDQAKEGPQGSVVLADTTEVKCQEQSNDVYEGSGPVFQPYNFGSKILMIEVPFATQYY